jgi:NitT/TauT family transport system substrate-binding protein
VAAVDEATAQINRDKRAAAEAYLRISKDKDSLENIVRMLEDPQIVYTTTPQNIMKYVAFMAKIGAIKVKPDSWRDLFFPNAHNLPGS